MADVAVSHDSFAVVYDVFDSENIAEICTSFVYFAKMGVVQDCTEEDQQCFKDCEMDHATCCPVDEDYAVDSAFEETSETLEKQRNKKSTSLAARNALEDTGTSRIGIYESAVEEINGCGRRFQSALPKLQKDAAFLVCDGHLMALALDILLRFLPDLQAQKLVKRKKSEQSQAKVDLCIRR